jgi:hypothetical protein
MEKKKESQNKCIRDTSLYTALQNVTNVTASLTLSKLSSTPSLAQRIHWRDSSAFHKLSKEAKL